MSLPRGECAMELQQLRYFLCARESASFAAVADRFHVSRQAISSSMKSLEGELSIEIFDRSNSGLTLTPEAKEFAIRAKETMDLFDRIQLRCSEPIAKGLSLALDSFLFEPCSCIFDSLFDYANSPHGCTIHLSQESFFRVLHCVEKRQSDIGIVRTMNLGIHDCETVILRTAYLGCIASKEGLLANRDYVSIGDLKDNSLILPNGFEQRYGKIVDAYIAESDNFPISVIDEKTIATEAVRKQFGIGITDYSNGQGRRVGEGVVYIPFKNPEYLVYDVLFFRKDNPKEIPIRAFANWIIDNDCWRLWELSHTSNSQ